MKTEWVCSYFKTINYSDVRVDVGLNRHIWSMGLRDVAKRVRVRLSRRRNEDEEAEEKVKFLFHSHAAISFIGSNLSSTVPLTGN